MLNNDRYFSVNPTAYMDSWNQDKDVLAMWRKPGDITDIPGWGNDMQFDTHLIENSSYMRLKNLQLSYDLPKQWIEATRFFKNIRITATARNLFTITKYSGADPEPVSNIQMNAYPNTRDYTIGAEVTF